MKAIRVENFGEPDVLKLTDMPAPQPGAGQVLVRLHAIGVNPVETYIRSGTYAVKPALPYTPGSDGAGVVESVGENVRDWKTGDRVYVAGSLSGTYAEFAVCEAAQAHPLPAGVSFEQGAAIGVPYATAFYALYFRAQAQPGETVLVHGASGGVGTAAVQIARALGLRVFGTAGTPRGLDLVRGQGAHAAFNHREADYVSKILDATGGRGVDVVLEMLANVNLAKDLSLVAQHGRIIVIGNRGNIEINPRDAMARGADIRGMTLFQATAQQYAAIHFALVAGLENKTLRPIIGREFSLADAPAAHRAVMEPGAFGKIVLKP